MSLHRLRGFTLLELMIGLALLGMLLLLLFGALRLGSKSWDAGEKRLNSASSQGVVGGFLRRSLSQIYPWRFKGVDIQALAFEGESAALRYVGPVPTRQGIAGLHFVSLEMQDDSLLLRWKMPSPDAEDFSDLADAEPVVLLKGVKQLALSYYGAQEGDTQPGWHDSWNDDQQLPAMIRLVLSMDEGGNWPEIVVATLLTSSANCAWDDFLKRCLNSSGTATQANTANPAKP